MKLSHKEKNKYHKNRSVVTRGEGSWDVGKRGQLHGDMNETFGGDHITMYTDVNL